MHFSDDELTRFHKDREQMAQHDAIASHLAACPDCRETLALFDEMDGALADPRVWEQVPTFLKQPPGLERLLAEKRRIERQNAEALRKLAPHLKSAMHFEDAEVPENARFHDAGVVRMLTARAASLRDSQPKFALQMASAAVHVARKLDGEPLLLACALRERANALRFVGKFKEAIAALDEAEPIFRTLPDAPFELAMVDCLRGLVLLEFDNRSAQALELGRRATRTFQEYGDQQRELIGRLLEAEAASNLEGAAAGAQAYQRVISLSLKLGQRAIAAHAYNNAAIKYAELGDFEEAQRHYTEALARHDELGNAVGAANTEWELARLCALRGELESGEKALAVARRKLLQLGLKEAHALATLDWAEARLALQKPEGVAAACREIVLRYESEGATRNARLAMAYAHEALARGTAEPALLREIRNYLLQLPGKPSVAFRPAT